MSHITSHGLVVTKPQRYQGEQRKGLTSQTEVSECNRALTRPFTQQCVASHIGTNVESSDLLKETY